MKIYTSDQFVLPLPEAHRFPMKKYERLRQRVSEARLVCPEMLFTPMAATDEELERVHSCEYIQRVQGGKLSLEEIRRIGFPWSPEMVERSRRSSGATIAACRSALEYGWGVNLAGGTHHAYWDRGEGFCVFNDSVVAARALQAEGRIRRVAVIDCDVHQGNGTAAILERDDSIFTFSIHSQRNYPLKKEKSDLDVGLEDGTGDDAYLTALEEATRSTLARSRAELAIYLAGADPYFGDRLGRLSLTKQGLAQRDRIVFDLCAGAGIPVAITMAGGYAADIEDIVDIHFQTVAEAARRALSAWTPIGPG